MKWTERKANRLEGHQGHLMKVPQVEQEEEKAPGLFKKIKKLVKPDDEE